MENNQSFEFTYCAEEQEEIRKIREKYLPPAENKMEQLRKLDAAVTRKGTAVSLVIGILGCLIFGAGMSCCLVWGDMLLLPGILLGIAGMAAMGAAYPMYAGITKKEKDRIAPQILKLTEELMK